MNIPALRTPTQRFEGLPDFPWAAHPLQLSDGLQMQRVDEGPRDAAHTFLCLHGQPTWSYLYRKMIPVFLEAGGRVVAPDFLGFGRSDKPTDEDYYGFEQHRDSLVQLVEALDLRRVTLVCQDWGGLLGLTLPPELPERFDRLIVMNTTLAVGLNPGEGFRDWLAFSKSRPDLDVGRLMKRSVPELTPAEVAAYDAPFPDIRHKAGVRTFPHRVPITPDMPGAQRSRQALKWWRERWSGPAFMAIGAQDPVLGPASMRWLHSNIRGCSEPLLLPQAGHFVQEHGEQVARAALQHFG